MKKNSNPLKESYIIDGNRTPFLKARHQPGPFSASDLAVQAGRTLLARQPFSPNDIDEVITGCVMGGPDEVNISRLIAMRLGCGERVPAYTVQRNCASGLQSIDNAVQLIQQGRAEIVLAGGTEAMSHAPLLWQEKMVRWLCQWSVRQSVLGRLSVLSRFKLSYLKPVIGLMKGLTDPLIGLNMGQTAENLAYRFGIDRESMDALAVESHHRLARAQEAEYFDEITPIIDNKGRLYETDEGVRPDSSMEKLAKLKPCFDKKYGLVTAGNSSQITDGAAYLIVASKDAVKKYQLPVLGKVVDTHWAALDPAQMGLGPVHACTPILQRQELQLADIDYFEINEAFAAQILACLAAWQDDHYCREQLGLPKAMGSINTKRLNAQGGAIALGHPVGASGTRLVLHMLHTLKRQQANYGLVSLCIGGGQGGAMLLQRVEEGHLL